MQSIAVDRSSNPLPFSHGSHSLVNTQADPPPPPPPPSLPLPPLDQCAGSVGAVFVCVFVCVCVCVCVYVCSVISLHFGADSMYVTDRTLYYTKARDTEDTDIC